MDVFIKTDFSINFLLVSVMEDDFIKFILFYLLLLITLLLQKLKYIKNQMFAKIKFPFPNYDYYLLQNSKGNHGNYSTNLNLIYCIIVPSQAHSTFHIHFFQNPIIITNHMTSSNLNSLRFYHLAITILDIKGNITTRLNTNNACNTCQLTMKFEYTFQALCYSMIFRLIVCENCPGLYLASEYLIK